MQNDFLNRYDKMCKIRIAPQDKLKNYRIKAWSTALGISAIFVGLFVYADRYETNMVVKGNVVITNQKKCSYCHNPKDYKKQKLTGYFKRIGSPNPEEMADAVLRTKSPRLLSAIAKVESRGDHRVVATGYKRRHHGAFQVNPKDWGKVPKDAAGQALQAERILGELTGNKTPIRVALNKYGGDTRGYYANDILRELQEVPR